MPTTYFCMFDQSDIEYNSRIQIEFNVSIWILNSNEYYELEYIKLIIFNLLNAERVN